MEINYSVAYVLTAAANTSDTATAFTVVNGRKFTLKKVQFVFPVGSGFYLRTWILRGKEPVVPNEGYVVGDGNVIPVECNIVFEGGHEVVVAYNNTDTTNTHQCLLVFEGVLE